MKGMSTMIKIRIRNDDHEIDLQFPISENKLYAFAAGVQVFILTILLIGLNEQKYSKTNLAPVIFASCIAVWTTRFGRSLMRDFRNRIVEEVPESEYHKYR